MLNPAAASTVLPMATAMAVPATVIDAQFAGFDNFQWPEVPSSLPIAAVEVVPSAPVLRVAPRISPRRANFA